ncbi:FAD-binding protein [Enhygromyxa salina]|uniref:Putative oxidoreductase ORF5 in fasciation locus n=1 Tax=Enhygromyxa salina TaxID=215803 RepID=A0A2S9YFT1_9BACT|nr:FAD-binding protein [Enhygromyxa salina]PRQ03968.1 putative oxidoreductase ORF5 in fasciation locus [Enhygromyxa salina]
MSGAEAFDPSDDFGHIIHRRAGCVVRPDSVGQLQQIIRDSGRANTRIVARGSGHSVFGQSQVQDGCVVDMRAIRHVAIEGDVAVVGAGATWAELTQHSLEHGMIPPVLTDYAGLSIGGTLSVGGIGAGSVVHGAQTDQVIELSVLVANGELIHCAANHEVELFDAMRGGLGQVGIIVAAKLKLIAAHTHARHLRAHYQTLDAWIIDLERMVAEGRQGQLSAVGTVDPDGQWHFHIDIVEPFSGLAPTRDRPLLDGWASQESGLEIADWPTLEYVTRLDPVIASWRASGLWKAPHPWVDVFVPAQHLRGFGRSVVASLDPLDLGVDGAMLLIYPICATSSQTPLLPISSGSGPAYLFDVLRCNPGASAERVDELLVANRTIYERALKLGGSLYPISAVEMSTTDWERHFGAQWQPWAAAKRRYDPDGRIGGQCRLF